MKRTLMQVYVKDSMAAVELYKEAFGAELVAAYPHGDGNGYMHAELDVQGQIIAVSEAYEAVVTGSTMQFCLHYGHGAENEAALRKAWDVLKQGALLVEGPLGECSYSPLEAAFVDRFGVRWCLFL